MKRFIIKWYKNEKYSTPIERSTEVQSISAQEALQALMKNNGTLKKITIIEIQEINAKGEPIGAPIKPMDE